MNSDILNLSYIVAAILLSSVLKCSALPAQPEKETFSLR